MLHLCECCVLFTLSSCNVNYRKECQFCIWAVVYGQEDASDDLYYQKQYEQRLAYSTLQIIIRSQTQVGRASPVQAIGRGVIAPMGSRQEIDNNLTVIAAAAHVCLSVRPAVIKRHCRTAGGQTTHAVNPFTLLRLATPQAVSDPYCQTEFLRLSAHSTACAVQTTASRATSPTGLHFYILSVIIIVRTKLVSCTACIAKMQRGPHCFRSLFCLLEVISMNNFEICISDSAKHAKIFKDTFPASTRFSSFNQTRKFVSTLNFATFS